MSILKRISAVTLTGIMCAGALAGCGGSSGSGSTSASGDSMKIGYVNLADTDVFCMSRRDACQEAVEAEGWSIEFTDGNNDPQKQIDQAKSFIAKGVDALVLIPCDAAGIVPAIEEANKVGVPVILIGNNAVGADDLDYTFIGSPHTESGIMQGELFAELLPENANICYLAGTSGLDHAAMRRDGMKQAFEEAGRTDITILDDQDCDYVKDKAMKTTQAWIQKYSDGKGGVTFQGIIAANDQMALGAMEALKSSQIPIGSDEGEVMITGIDGTDDALNAVKEGTMVQTVLQDAPAQGEAVVAVLKTLQAGEKPDREVMIPYVSVTAENVDEYLG